MSFSWWFVVSLPWYHFVFSYLVWFCISFPDHMMNSKQIKDALSTLSWKVLSQEGHKLNCSFIPPCICSSNYSISLSQPHHLCCCVNAHLALSLSVLSGCAGGECHRLGGRYGSDLLPLAELWWIHRGHPESPPPDPFLQRHKRCVLHVQTMYVYPWLKPIISSKFHFAFLQKCSVKYI